MLSVSPVKKTKKNEARHFRHLVRIDRTAFGKLENQVAVLSLFWKSTETRFILALWTTPSSQTIVGYAAYQLNSAECYLLRIAVDSQLRTCPPRINASTPQTASPCTPIPVAAPTESTTGKMPPHKAGTLPRRSHMTST